MAEVSWEVSRSNPSARDWAKEHAAELIDGITATTRDAIQGIVEDAFDEGRTVAEVADEIDQFLGDENRAELIARTETMTAANAGQQEAWDQAVEDGFLTGEEKQEWITTPDDKLCPICTDMDGEQVGLDEQFDVDGDLIDAPPAHPNCRCTIGLVVPGA